MHSMSFMSKSMLCSVLLLLATFAFSIRIEAQPVFDDTRFGCADTSAQYDTIWNTAQRIVEVPGVSAPCHEMNIMMNECFQFCGE